MNDSPSLNELCDIDAERNCLCFLMRDITILERFPLQATDFSFTAYRIIFEAIVTMQAHSISTDPLMVMTQLKQNGKIDEAGGCAAIWEIAEAVSSNSPARHYCEVLIDLGHKARMVKNAQTLAYQIQDGQDFSGTVQAMKDLTEEQNVVTAKATPGFVKIADILPSVLEQVDKAYRGGVRIGLTTGLQSLDTQLGGLELGTLVTLASRPGMGKSSLAATMALANSKAGKTVAILSLEMSNSELLKRMITMQQGEFTVKNLNAGQLTPHGWQVLVASSSAIEPLPIYLCDDFHVSIDVLLEKIAILKRAASLDLLIVDYIGLMKAENTRVNRVEQVGEVTRGLKLLSLSLDIPVVLLSQLNRDLEKRPLSDRRPHLSDLRESGAIEQDSDVVLFLYRDHVYNPDLENREQAEIIIGKNRNGPLATAQCRWIGPQTLFADL